MSTQSPFRSAVLHDLLMKRLSIISDQNLRARDPAAQLDQLREVSEAIMRWHDENRASIPPRLDHFLRNSSLQKALDYISGAQD